MAEINITDEAEQKDERLPLKFATQTKRLVCIEYPGYVKDISKALKTLGGEKQLNATLQDPLRRIGLHFRPNDPYCRQSFGDRFPVTDLLMKVKRKKRKKNGKEEVHYECEILGVIDTVVKFKALADFQYLAPKIPDFLDNLYGSEILEIDTALHIPPPAFCRVDHPFDYQYRADPVRKDGDAQATEQGLGKTTRKPRPSNTYSCHFHAPKIPTEPKEAALKELKRYHDDGLDIVQRLFNTRPIWSRRAIIYHLGKRGNRVKSLLPCVAYYWVGGPWRTLYTKFGYDPRKNPAAKIYQKLDFRLRSKKALRGLKLPPRVRTTHEFPLTTRYQKNVSNSVVPLGVGNNSEKPKEDSEKPSTSSENPEDGMSVDRAEAPEVLPYVFYPERPPVTRQIIYQLCDIRCAEVQKLISANDGRERECSDSEGWLEPGTNEKIRVVMTNSLVALSEKQQTAGGQEAAGESFAGEEQSAEMEEEEARFLDTLMDDDDVEAYELLDDF